MPEQQYIALTDLLIDLNNPRMEVQAKQRDAIRAMAAGQGRKLFVLAQHIINHGMNPAELLIVTPSLTEPTRYIVLEGNRRVAALKILAEPGLVEEAVTASLLKQYKRLAGKFQENPIEQLPCTVFESREEANLWIELRHTGEREGAGIVSWGGTERARFDAREGEVPPQLQVLEFLKQHGTFDEATRAKLGKRFITNLERLVRDPYVRRKLGLDLRRGQVLMTYSTQEVLKGLTKVVSDFTKPKDRMTVTDIKRKPDRERYIDNFQEEELPDPSSRLPEPRLLSAGDGEADGAIATSTTPRSRKRSRPASGTRQTLIPKSVVLEIDDNRINNIYLELKRINVDDFPNAAAVMFRVFLELSLDYYVDKNGVADTANITKDSKLQHKLHVVGTFLKQMGLMDDEQLKPVRKAAVDNELLVSSVTTMNAFVHSRFVSPRPLDVKITWDNLQPFIEAILS